MKDKEGVLEMGPGKERLSFPGPGGYTIQWSPGTRHFPLEPAPSGHLIKPCDEYSKVKPPTGLPRPSTTFHATSRSSSCAAPLRLEELAAVGNASGNER